MMPPRRAPQPREAPGNEDQAPHLWGSKFITKSHSEGQSKPKLARAKGDEITTRRWIDQWGQQGWLISLNYLKGYFSDESSKSINTYGLRNNYIFSLYIFFFSFYQFFRERERESIVEHSFISMLETSIISIFGSYDLEGFEGILILNFNSNF